MDEDFREQLADYFTSEELVYQLNIPIKELIDLISEYVIDQETELKDFMRNGN